MRTDSGGFGEMIKVAGVNKYFRKRVEHEVK